MAQGSESRASLLWRLWALLAGLFRSRSKQSAPKKNQDSAYSGNHSLGSNKHKSIRQMGDTAAPRELARMPEPLDNTTEDPIHPLTASAHETKSPQTEALNAETIRRSEERRKNLEAIQRRARLMAAHGRAADRTQDHRGQKTETNHLGGAKDDHKQTATGERREQPTTPESTLQRLADPKAGAGNTSNNGSSTAQQTKPGTSTHPPPPSAVPPPDFTR